MKRLVRTPCLKPAMSNKRTILTIYQCTSCRALAIELVRQNTNRSKQSGHREPSWPSGMHAVTPQDVILTQDVIIAARCNTIYARCNNYAKCNNFYARCNKIKQREM